jgi:CRP-like cAMP-binding protein
MQEQASILAVLNSWFASGLDPAIQTRLVELSRPYTAAPGTQLFKEGDQSDILGIVTRGRVALRTLVAERGDITILTVEPGDIFGWSAIVPPYRATSTAVAIEPVEAVVMEGPALRAALREDCALAHALYPRVMVAMARRLNATRLQLLDLFAAEAVKTW